MNSNPYSTTMFWHLLKGILDGLGMVFIELMALIVRMMFGNFSKNGRAAAQSNLIHHEYYCFKFL